MASLKNLFNEGMTAEIKDEDGQVLSVRIQALRQHQQLEIAERMDQFKAETRRKYDNVDNRATIQSQYEGLSPADIIGHIITMEKPSAASVVDLAPSPDEETRPETTSLEDWERQRQDKVLARWEKERREGLDGMATNVLLEMLVQRRMQMAINIQVQNFFVRSVLVYSIVDPQTRKPLLTAAREDTEKDEDVTFIGDLMPDTWNALTDLWNQFTDSQTEKNIRKLAEKKSFLSSGKQEKRSVDSPGETIETSTSSPQGPSSSSQNVVGSTK